MRNSTRQIMKWRKRGLLFDVHQHKLPFDCVSHAQSPQALVLDDRVRVYFCTRKPDGAGMFLSHVAFVDFDFNFDHILGISNETVIPLGDIGTFDEHGIFPFSPFKHENEIWGYTCGWSRRVSVPVETSTGLVKSVDGGRSFSRIGRGPVLSATPSEPVLVGDSFVQKLKGDFHMWYIFGTKWIPEDEDEPVARVYKIGHAISGDGLSWKRENSSRIIPDVLGPDECQALPSVAFFDGVYHMVFCYREAKGFRNEPQKAYRLGYALSRDLKSWERKDDELGLNREENSWDSEMMCYPNVFALNGKLHVLYNGNEFGKHGFGLAVSE